jgi:hypothetical protein
VNRGATRRPRPDLVSTLAYRYPPSGRRVPRYQNPLIEAPPKRSAVPYCPGEESNDQFDPELCLPFCNHSWRGQALTPRSVLEKFAAMQMIDVQLPTTDGRKLSASQISRPMWPGDRHRVSKRRNLRAPLSPTHHHIDLRLPQREQTSRSRQLRTTVPTFAGDAGPTVRVRCASVTARA